jgi:hypothetical protein
MRTLNDYFIDGGSRTNINTGGVASVFVTVPDDGKLAGVSVAITSSPTTVAHSFNVWVNNVDTGVLVHLTEAMGANTGVVALPDGTVNVKAGDTLRLTSNNETANTPTANFNWIIRR